MDSLEKLSQQEFDRLYDEYTVSADKNSEFYTAISRNVNDIREMNIDNSVRESLYAQVINSIYFNKELKNMDGLERFFESIGKLFTTIIEVSDKVIQSNDEIRQNVYKAKYYQQDTSEKIAEIGKTINNLTDYNNKIADYNAKTQKNLENLRKIEEGRNRPCEN